MFALGPIGPYRPLPVIHLAESGALVKPVNYLFMNNLPDFQDFLDEFLAARPRCCSKAVQRRIDITVTLAMKEWHEAWLSTWDAVSAELNLSGVCLLCNGPHTLVECNAIQGLFDAWREELGYEAGVKALQEPRPGTVGAAMHFIGNAGPRTPLTKIGGGP